MCHKCALTGRNFGEIFPDSKQNIREIHKRNLPSISTKCTPAPIRCDLDVCARRRNRWLWPACQLVQNVAWSSVWGSHNCRLHVQGRIPPSGVLSAIAFLFPSHAVAGALPRSYRLLGRAALCAHCRCLLALYVMMGCVAPVQALRPAVPAPCTRL